MSFKELKIEKESATVLYLSTYLSFPVYFISSCSSKLPSVSFPSSLKNFLWKFYSSHARFIGYIILGGQFHQIEHVTLMFSRFFFSDDRSIINCTAIPLNVRSYSFLSAFKIYLGC